MAVVVSNTLDFTHTSYYYHYNSGTGVSTNSKFLASSYAPYAIYWAYSADAVYGKNPASAIIKLTKATYTISSGKTITVRAACAPLVSTSDATDNIILSKNSSKFGAMSGSVTLPTTGSVDLDITSVVAYAAQNYNRNWGLYLIGGGNTGYASKVTITTPTFSSLVLTSGIMNLKEDDAWKHGVPYIYKNGSWVPSSGLYVNNGTNWVQVTQGI